MIDVGGQNTCLIPSCMKYSAGMLHTNKNEGVNKVADWGIDALGWIYLAHLCINTYNMDILEFI